MPHRTWCEETWNQDYWILIPFLKRLQRTLYILFSECESWCEFEFKSQENACILYTAGALDDSMYSFTSPSWLHPSIVNHNWFFFFFTNLSLHQICRSFSTWYAFLVEQSLRFWNHTMLFKKFLTYHPFYGSLIHHFIKLKIPSPTSLHRSVACNMRCRFIWTHPQDLRHIWQRLFLYLHLGLTWPRHKLDSDWPPLGHKANALKPSSQWPFTERQILIKLLELSAQANI